jgi:hypothetical protein
MRFPVRRLDLLILRQRQLRFLVVHPRGRDRANASTPAATPSRAREGMAILLVQVVRGYPIIPA